MGEKEILLTSSGNNTSTTISSSSSSTSSSSSSCGIKCQRQNLMLELKKLASIEQTLLIAENLRLLPFSLLKYIKVVCDDLVQQKSESALLSGGDGPDGQLIMNIDSIGLDASLIFEEQANDLSKVNLK